MADARLAQSGGVAPRRPGRTKRMPLLPCRARDRRATPRRNARRRLHAARRRPAKRSGDERGAIERPSARSARRSARCAAPERSRHPARRSGDDAGPSRRSDAVGARPRTRAHGTTSATRCAASAARRWPRSRAACGARKPDYALGVEQPRRAACAISVTRPARPTRPALARRSRPDTRRCDDARGHCAAARQFRRGGRSSTRGDASRAGR